MRRLRTLLRRSVVVIALLTFVLTLVWWVRTWELAEAFGVYHEQEEVVNGTAYKWFTLADIISLRGKIELNTDNTSSYMQRAEGWKFRHDRPALAHLYTFNPVNQGMAEHLDLTVDGSWPILSKYGVAFALYVATDGVAAYNEKLVPDPTGRIFFRLQLPHWLIASVSALIFLLAIRPDWRARRRRKKGLCIGCGYDLRGSVESGRCSECGRVIDEAQMEKLREIGGGRS